MAGPFKIPVMLLATGMFALGAYGQGHAQKPQQQRPPRIQVDVGGHNVSRPRMGDWLRLNRGKSFDQQKKSLESDPDFKNLPPERQERLKQRLQNFNNLPPDQQDRILARIDKFEHMTPQQRAQARALWDRMRLLPEERRGMVRQQIHSLAGQSPDQRQKTLTSDQFGKQFTPDERDIIQRGLELSDTVPSPGTDEAPH
ncbi:MAG: DUF3106 domain-containing protein [Terriglobales bacterium]